MIKRNVGLAMPFRGASVVDLESLLIGVRMKASSRPDTNVAPGHSWCSLLTYNFNLLWTMFLNMRDQDGITHFAMLHDDIHVEVNWVDTLIDLMEENDADLVSCVVPIKDARGLTSTALDVTPDPWNPQRLTMREIHKLPVTFDDATAGGPLLLNTGCWGCRLDRPWVDQVRFRQQDEIRVVNGKREAHTIPEDWDFSRQVRAAGGKLIGTRKVKLHHERPVYTNAKPWGEWATDEDCRKYFAKPEDQREKPSHVATGEFSKPLAL